MITARVSTLGDLALPRDRAGSAALLVLAAALATALAARVSIPLPFSPVPLTGQTWAVLLSGAVLGARRAFLAQALYLGSGALGLPVFAGGAAGLSVLLGPSGGYAAAFPFAAAVTGALAERGWDRGFFSMLTAMLLGSAVIFAAGLAGLARFVPSDHLLSAGLFPFLPGDLIKSSLAAVAFPALWRRSSRRSNGG